MRIRKEIVCIVALVISALFSAHDGMALNFQEATDQLAQKIVETALKERIVKIAVVDFPKVQGLSCNFGRYLPDHLAGKISQNQDLSVIHRNRITQMLAHLGLTPADMSDPQKARRFAKTIAAEVLVIGSFADMNNQIIADVKMINVDSYQTLFGASANISKDQTVQMMLTSGCQQARPSVLSEPPLNPEQFKVPSSGPPYIHKANGFDLNLTGIERMGEGIIVSFNVSNTVSNATNSPLFRAPLTNAYLVDAAENQYPATREGDLRIRRSEPLAFGVSLYDPSADCRNIKSYFTGMGKQCTLLFVGVNPKAQSGSLLLTSNSDQGSANKQINTVWENLPFNHTNFQPANGYQIYRRQINEFMFNLAGTEKKKDLIQVYVSVKNMSNFTVTGAFDINGTYIADAGGNKYAASNSQTAGGIDAGSSSPLARLLGSNCFQKITLAPGGAQKCLLTFTNVNPMPKTVNIFWTYYSFYQGIQTRQAKVIWDNVILEGY